MDYKQGENMELTSDQKEAKKELAKFKRKVVELAGEVHDIVEDRIWTDYVKLGALSEEITLAMKEVLDFQEQHPYLK